MHIHYVQLVAESETRSSPSGLVGSQSQVLIASKVVRSCFWTARKDVCRDKSKLYLQVFFTAAPIFGLWQFTVVVLDTSHLYHL